SYLAASCRNMAKTTLSCFGSSLRRIEASRPNIGLSISDNIRFQCETLRSTRLRIFWSLWRVPATCEYCISQSWCPSQILSEFRAILAGDRTCRIHLRTLSTGEPHPLAPQSAMIVREVRSTHSSYSIQVSGDRLGILFICDHEA